MDSEDDLFDAKVKVLGAQVAHDVGKEEGGRGSVDIALVEIAAAATMRCC